MRGTAGTGKSTVAAQFCDAACRRGERALYFAFEESPGQLLRNMRSIGIDLEPWVKKGLLQRKRTRRDARMYAVRLTAKGKSALGSVRPIATRVHHPGSTRPE